MSQSAMKTPENSTSFVKLVTKLMLYFIIFSFITFIGYSFKVIHPAHLQNLRVELPISSHRLAVSKTETQLHNSKIEETTQLHHIVFGIAASANLWENRKNYIKLWWKPEQMRGFVWLDKTVSTDIEDQNSLPQLKISTDTSKFGYTNKKGDRSALRLSRIVSETVRIGLNDVRWIVLGDDDTFFVPDNLLKVLSKYDHNQFYYIGSTSESHLQNIRFSYSMAYGGGGFAISYPLAKALEKMQDRCMMRYPELYGSDDRIQACMAELGVPLTKEIGFHQVLLLLSSFLFKFLPLLKNFNELGFMVTDF